MSASSICHVARNLKSRRNRATEQLNLTESERWILRNLRKLDDDALLDLMSALRPSTRVEAHHV